MYCLHLPTKEFLLWVFFSSSSNFCFSWNPLKQSTLQTRTTAKTNSSSSKNSLHFAYQTHRLFGYFNISIVDRTFQSSFLDFFLWKYILSTKHDYTVSQLLGKFNMYNIWCFWQLQLLNKSHHYNFWTKSIFTICGQIQ